MAKIQGILSCVILMMVEIDLNIHQNEYVAHVAHSKDMTTLEIVEMKMIFNLYYFYRLV